MMIARISGATRNLGAPPDWQKDTMGTCGGLPIRDGMHAPGVPCMTSAWTPTPDEAARLAAGATIYLTVLGRAHPAVAMVVGDAP